MLRRLPGAALLLLLVAFLLPPWPVRLRWRDPESTSFMRYREREARGRGETLPRRHEWVPLDRIAPALLRAAVHGEDPRFYEHRGIDWHALAEEVQYDGEPPFSLLEAGDLRALARAARFAWTHRNELRGRSTITQQLAKNLYLVPERSVPRKAAEFVVAKRLEWLLSKDRILELYLNTVELGPGIFGAEAAAREYFGVSAAELTPFQAASLAATLPHPRTANPRQGSELMALRRNLILMRMAAEQDTAGAAGTRPASRRSAR